LDCENPGSVALQKRYINGNGSLTHASHHRGASHHVTVSVALQRRVLPRWLSAVNTPPQLLDMIGILSVLTSLPTGGWVYAYNSIEGAGEGDPRWSAMQR